MANPPARSVSTELMQGMVDGSYKQVVKDRGGMVESCTADARSDLSCKYYGIHDAPVMYTPDARTFVSPYHAYNAPADSPMGGIHG